MEDKEKIDAEFQQLMQVDQDVKKVDIVEKSIGVFGRWHLYICFLISLAKLPSAWVQLNIVFVAPLANFSCFDNDTDKCSKNCSEHIYDRSLFTETITTQWDLVCENAQLANLAQTITMSGILVGNFLFGILADKFGRRNSLVLAVIIQIVTGTVMAFLPWFWLFLVCRFLCALATGGTMVTTFVLVMELVGSKWRTEVGILYQIPFNLGHLSLALIGYLIRDWRYFQLTITLPSLILLSYYWIIPESPRWLLAVGQQKKAIKIMEKAAHHNRLPTDGIKDDVKNYMTNESTEHKKGRLLDLVSTSNLRIKTFCICFNWVVCGLCFYGGAQYMGQLGGNIFVNVAISAVIQLPGTFVAIWLTKRFGRKYTLIGANILTGLSFLFISLVPYDLDWVKVFLGTVGIFGLSLCFPTVYIYSGELYPTVIRNIGVGTSSTCARIGSMLAPYVAGLAVIEPWMPPVVFGVIPLIGAVLGYYLPETLNCKLPETLEDAELFGKNVKNLET
ncbi:hypothetical protein RN001_006544 [Aquatica leii]|uniref:Major facilitator superfamily (MFS) profile domain-containing protein n=1 Tax=Aquatica leii TaxID=1421715 RepID=A0AAN7P886_9COLE|nr:hypothetical protein RN001_006544 [Aquatica leii]